MAIACLSVFPDLLEGEAEALFRINSCYEIRNAEFRGGGKKWGACLTILPSGVTLPVTLSISVFFCMIMSSSLSCCPAQSNGVCGRPRYDGDLFDSRHCLWRYLLGRLLFRVTF